MRILDAFCCAGGAGEGYRRAGFEVVGVDIEPQPNYQAGEFIQGDAIEFILEHGREFTAGHGSPPCQLYSPLNAYNHKTYPDLIAPTREAFRQVGLPYIIENVEAARPELRDPVMLCGPMFGLRMYRHRLFETSFPVEAPLHWDHEHLCSRNGYLPTLERPFMTITGGRHSAAWRESCGSRHGDAVDAHHQRGVRVDTARLYGVPRLPTDVPPQSSGGGVTDPLFNPGRRLYEQARRLQRAKRQYLLRRGVTAIPVGDAQVLKFQPRPVPPDKEVS